MEISAVILIIVFVILMGFNRTIYHRIFSDTYFNFKLGYITELAYAWIAASFELTIIIFIGDIIKMWGLVGKLILVALTISLAVFIVGKVVQKEKKETTGLDMKEAKTLADSSVKALKKVSREKADSIKTKLEAEGAKVILKLSQEQEVVPDKKNNLHMIVCSSCGKMINEDAKFCNFCGYKIVRIDTAVCPNCGNQITADTNFCPCCGEKIRKDS